MFDAETPANPVAPTIVDTVPVAPIDEVTPLMHRIALFP